MKKNLAICLLSANVLFNCQKDPLFDETKYNSVSGVNISNAIDSKSQIYASDNVSVMGYFWAVDLESVISEGIKEVGYIYDTVQNTNLNTCLKYKKVGNEIVYHSKKPDSVFCLPQIMGRSYNDPCYSFEPVNFDSLVLNSCNNYFRMYLKTNAGRIYYTSDNYACSRQGVWQKFGDYPGSNSIGAIGFSILGKGYIIGGNSENVWCYNPVIDEWSQLNNFPMKLDAPKIFIINYDVYVCSEKLSIENKNFWKYNVESDSWESKTNYPFDCAGREIISFSYGGFGYCFANETAGLNTQIVYRYNPDSSKWSLHKSFYASLNQYPCLFQLGKFIFIISSNRWNYYRIDLSDWQIVDNFLCLNKGNPCSYSGLAPQEGCSFVLEDKAFVMGKSEYISGYPGPDKYRFAELYTTQHNEYNWYESFNFPSEYKNGQVFLIERKRGITFVINGIAYMGLGYSVETSGTNVSLKDIWSFKIK